MTKKIIFLSLISTLFVGCVAFPEDGYYDGRYDHRYDYDDRRYDQHDRYERSGEEAQGSQRVFFFPQHDCRYGGSLRGHGADAVEAG